MAAHTTTEEHQPPSDGGSTTGRPVLLCAFPLHDGLLVPPGDRAVGRAWLAAGGVHDTEVSSEHVRFSRSDGRVYVADAGSRNGTWIDGVRLPPGERAPLHDGALLRLGRSLFVHRASFAGELERAPAVGRLVGPWGLGAVRECLAELSRIRPRNVLVEGATGTGKELVAAAVMQALGRAKNPYVSVNVAAVAAGVFEAQLFGWVRGAYSGSADGGEGIFRKNDGGTVFLDEIGELPAELQPKLLRVLENREVLPVGASKPAAVDVAVVAATNRPLEEAVARSAFRRDLLARFTARIALPSLAERPEDVYAILEALAERRGVALEPGRVEVEAVERLALDPWPGNVRDLDRVAATLSSGSRLTLAAVEKVLGPRPVGAVLTREAAEQMLRECRGNEREVERRFAVKRGKLRRALGKA